MRTRAATKWIGGLAATLVVTMVASVAPASANTDSGTTKSGKGSSVVVQRDTGWN